MKNRDLKYLMFYYSGDLSSKTKEKIYQVLNSHTKKTTF